MHERIPEIASQIAAEFASLSYVRGIVIGGSRAVETNDPASDIDIYVYADRDIPIEFRARLARRFAQRSEIDNRVWETGDEWDDAASGVHVDIMYRNPKWLEGALDSLLNRHQSQIGYTTCICFNVATSIPLYDPVSWFANVQSISRRPYPEALKQAIIKKNLPLLRSAYGSFRSQILKAVQRDDRVSVNHRLAALLASYFDILFAINGALHPGEKRLVKYARRLRDKPQDFEVDIDEILTHEFTNVAASAERIDRLCEGLERCVISLGLTSGGTLERKIGAEREFLNR